jgi:hypothetical protein
MNINWPPLIIGVVTVICGLLALRWRIWLARTTATLQRATFGRGGSFIADRSTPRGVIFPASGTVAVGVVLILLSLFYRRYS